MWTGWRRCRAGLPTSSPLAESSLHRTCHTLSLSPSLSPRNPSRSASAPHISSRTVFTSALHTTRILLDQHHHSDHEKTTRDNHRSERKEASTQHQPAITTSNVPAGLHVSHSANSKTDERTADLLRSIARRGGGAIRRARSGTSATDPFFSTAPNPADMRGNKEESSTAHRSRGMSPLAKLFAAPSAPSKSVQHNPSAGKHNGTTDARQSAPKGTKPATSADTQTTAQATHNTVSNRAAESPPSPPPPSRALLEKLLLTIQREKRVPWAAVTAAHPEVQRMPLYHCRDAWCAQIQAMASATPLPLTADTTQFQQQQQQQELQPPPLFLCAASTGTGKSVLLPLYALDAHWAALEQRLQRTLDVYDELVEQRGQNVEQTVASKSSVPQNDKTAAWTAAPFTLTSQAAFIREFTACSRLCIVVSQPTRVACAELAQYTSALLHPTANAPGNDVVGQQEHQQLVGKRVGYAVGGSTQFCAETELIYATPGYILNAIQHPSPSSTAAQTGRLGGLRPTTLMVDEAHCRDVSTDALLAWMKLSRLHYNNSPGSASNIDATPTSSVLRSSPVNALRQYYVMSATMSVAAMDAYLSKGVDPHNKQTSRMETSGQTVKGGHENSVDHRAPLLLLSPSQRAEVHAWWKVQQQRRGSTPHQKRSGESDVDEWAGLMQHDARVRRAVLCLVEATEGETCNSSSNSSSSSGSHVHRAAVPPTPAAAAAVSDEGDLPHGVVASTEPYRVERFFMDDIEPDRGCFAQSRVLFSDDVRRAAAAASEHSRTDFANGVGAAYQEGRRLGMGMGRSDGRMGAARTEGNSGSGNNTMFVASSPSFGALPTCLSSEGVLLRRTLAQLLGTRPSAYNFQTSLSRLLASFVLEMMQAARQRWVAPANVTATSAPTTTTIGIDKRTNNFSERDSGARRHNHNGTAAAAPVTVLVFVPGIAEMQQLLHSLERVCERVSHSQHQHHHQATPSSMSSGSTSNVSVEVLRHDGETFSIGLLHSTAIGSPQEQLTATENTAALLRLLIATNVAESSLTIANTRIVIDTCLERRVRADDVTGTTRVTTAFVSPSGLRQRCGRVGRTGDGVVIHLAPRGYVLPPADTSLTTTALRTDTTTTTTTRRTNTRDRSAVPVVETEEKPAMSLEPLADGVVTVLLQMKYLFGSGVAAALAALPVPPTAAEARVALQQLVDMDLLLLPAQQRSNPATTPLSTKSGEAVLHRSSTAGRDAETEQLSEDTTRGFSLTELLNRSSFTPKGLLVASLPLPYEHASLVYHGLQFLCVEDAIMMACAMSVPSLFITPRISAVSILRSSPRHSTNSDFTWANTAADAKPALSPLEAFYKRVWRQRELAGFDTPKKFSATKEGSTAVGTSGEPLSRVGHLSEPLVLRALLRKWYTAASVTDTVNLLSTYAVNRSTMRLVDSLVDQCCQRLLSLLRHDRATRRRTTRAGEREDDVLHTSDVMERAEDNGEEKDFGAYVDLSTSQVRSRAGKGTTTKSADNRSKAAAEEEEGVDMLVGVPFVQTWPDGMEDQLIRSLQRLQRAAHSRVHLRGSHSRFRSGFPQWYDAEERSIRLCSQAYVQRATTPFGRSNQSDFREHQNNFTAGEGTGNRENGEEDSSEVEAQQQQQHCQQREKAVRQHPSFKYWNTHALAQRKGQRGPFSSLLQSYPTLPMRTVAEAIRSSGSNSSSAAPVEDANTPPPLKTSLTRSRSPVYRPPPPPPPLPPVAYLLGRTEDRLCAAFVAAFSHRTMRGEDGSHRFHRRRLVRNLQALENDADHVCTFNIDVQTQGRRITTVAEITAAAATSTLRKKEEEYGEFNGLQKAGHAEVFTSAPAAAAAAAAAPRSALDDVGVSPQAVRAALAPFLAGCGLQQLEVFQGNRLAVAARFAADGFDGLFAAVAAAEAEAMTDSTTGIDSSSSSCSSNPAQLTSGGAADIDEEEEEEGTSEMARMKAKWASRGSSVADEEGGGGSGSNAPLNVQQVEGRINKNESSRSATVEGVEAKSALLRPVPLSSIRLDTSNMTVSKSSISPATAADKSPSHVGAGPSPPPTGLRGHSIRGTSGNPYVQLAPFGVSVLVAAAAGGGGTGQSGLQRIPLDVVSPPATVPTTPAVAASAPSHATTSSHVDAVPQSSLATRSAAATADVDVRRSLRFTANDAQASVGWTVAWADIFGTFSHQLRQDEVMALGLGDLFPQQEPQQQDEQQPPSAVHSAGGVKAAVAASSANRHSHTDAATNDDVVGTLTSEFSPSPTLTVVPPVYITRSITWKVPLPTTLVVPEEFEGVGKDLSSSTLLSASPSSFSSQPALPSRTPLRYCVVCQQLCGSRQRFEQHLRSAVHLEHLRNAVRVGLRRDELEMIYGYPPHPQQQQQQQKKNKGSGDGPQGGGRVKNRGRENAPARTLHEPRASVSRSPPSSVVSTLTYAAAPLLSLLSLDNNSSSSDSTKHLNAVDKNYGAPPRLLAQQLHPCVIHPLSFLNCLQWNPRSSSSNNNDNDTGGGATEKRRADVDYADGSSGEADRATPLAVAGGLVAMQAAADVLPPPHLRQPTLKTSDAHTGVSAAAAPAASTTAASTLSAHHVWVLDVSATSAQQQQQQQQPAPPPLSLLFVLAGYLAAASPQAMVAFLCNDTHSHLHGVMLYGLGVWRLPDPLPMTAYMGVLEHITQGGSWPGLLVPLHRHRSSCSDSNAPGRYPYPPKVPRAAVYEALHWCVPAAECGAGPHTPESPTNNAFVADVEDGSKSNDAADAALRALWPTVEATLLLTLHEYLQAQRNMITLADFVERVLLKLQHSPFLNSTEAPCTLTASQVLAHFMAVGRRGQGIHSLLRDVGCVFLTPPQVLSSLLHDNHAAEPFASSESLRWSKRLSQRALGAEGASLELMFTVPPVLPSVLPAADFANQLRVFYETRHAQRWTPHRHAPPQEMRMRKNGSAAVKDRAAGVTKGVRGEERKAAVVGARVAKMAKAAPASLSKNRRGAKGGKWDDRLLF